MRFEWLFIGYVFMFQLPVGEITLLPFLAYLIMLFATVRLAKFENAFKRARNVLLVAVPIGAVLLTLQILKTTVPSLAAAAALNYSLIAVRIMSECAEMAVMFFIYVGVKIIGTNTEIRSLEKHASRNMTVMLVYFVFEMTMTVVSLISPELFTGYEIVKVYPFVIGFIWRILNLWMIITCYLSVSVKDEKSTPETAEESGRPHFPQKKKKKKHRR